MSLLYRTFLTLRNYRLRSPFYLLLLYKFTIIKYLNRLLGLDIRSQKLFGRVLKFQDFEQFYVGFIDTFIEMQHHFVTAKRSPFIVDAGANLGMATFYLKRMYPLAKIVAIEPDPDNFEDLKHNTRGMDGVTILPVAIADKDGELFFYRDTSKTRTGGSLLYSFSRGKKITVPVRTLSSIITKDVDFLKIDVEGMGAAVFRDLAKVKYRIWNIFFEYHYRIKDHANSLGEIIGFFEERDYQYVVESHMLSPMGKLRTNYGLNIYAYLEPREKSPRKRRIQLLGGDGMP